MALSTQDHALVKALQHGLPLTERPFASVALQVGMEERAVIQRIEQFEKEGLVKRTGVIVRHHELGFRSNAMVVWDVEDTHVDQVGAWLGSQEQVSLCYRRPRHPPHWPYNLFCMLHGQERAQIRARIHALRKHPALEAVPYALLFSTRRFKQRGARYRFDRPDPAAPDGYHG